jgi:EmrB/QacA subfamily drug resistance transporter
VIEKEPEMDAPHAARAGAIPLFQRPEVHARRWFLLGVLCLSLVVVVMSVSSLNVAAPTMQQELGASATAVQWILDAYVLVFAGLLLATAAIGDRFGRREALVGGLVVFGAGAVVAGLASSAGVVIVGRGIQGVGAAFIMPATLSLITAIFPPEELGKAIAIWVGFASAGGAMGQVMSGALLERFWWGSTVLVNVPLVLAVAVVILVFSPRSRDDHATPLDPVGALLSLVGFVALLFGIIEGPARGWSDGLVVAAFAVSIVVLAAFVAWELRIEHPMLPLDLFRDRRFSVGGAMVTLTFFAMVGFWFLSSQFLQFGRGYSPLLAGVAILPMAATSMLLSPRSAALAQRYGSGPTMVVGFGVMASGFVVLASVTVSAPWVVVIGASVLLAMGMSLTMAPATGSIMHAVPVHRAGIGSAVNDVTRELGSALGIAVLGSVVNATYRSRVDLSGVAVPAELADAAGESVGAANGVAAAVGGAEAEALRSRAAEAFGDAFNLASAVSAAIAVLAAVVVATTLSRRKERVAAGAAPEPAWAQD